MHCPLPEATALTWPKVSTHRGLSDRPTWEFSYLLDSPIYIILLPVSGWILWQKPRQDYITTWKLKLNLILFFIVHIFLKLGRQLCTALRTSWSLLPRNKAMPHVCSVSHIFHTCWCNCYSARMINVCKTSVHAVLSVARSLVANPFGGHCSRPLADVRAETCWDTQVFR